MNTERVALVGSGETAKRVADILANRQDLEVFCFSHHAAGQTSRLGMAYLRPHPDTILATCSLTLLCTKDRLAMNLVPALLRSPHHRCIDISGAYRVRWKDERFRQIYGFPHTDLGRSSTYGLPELQDHSKLRNARLIATAGTVSTGALLALVPLAIRKTISPTGPVRIEASCGTSGFGKSDRVAGGIVRSDPEMELESEARHEPEILHGFRCLTGCELNLIRPPRIAMSPQPRGVEARVRFIGTKSRRWTEAKACYLESYPLNGLVQIPTREYDDGEHLVGTHFCELSLDRSAKDLTVIARLDNLGKGGPSQLVQNLNIAMGKDPLRGLL